MTEVFPPFQISTRARGKWRGGRRVAKARLVWDRPQVSGQPRLPSDPVIFVHGYNVRQSTAQDAWETTISKLGQRLRSRPPLLNRIGVFYWPGDLFANKWLATAAYSLQIPRAKASARELVAFLPGVTDERDRISFVAHSLGCRVVLETLRLMRNEPRLCDQVDRVLLMAAAVPEGLCRAARTYGEPSAPHREGLLWSRSDNVLRVAFRPGQFLARRLGREEPVGSTKAVGLTGLPIGRWDQAEETGLDHGAYWTNDRAITRIEHLVRNGNVTVRQEPRRREWRREIVSERSA
jgi:esterase/lipase superfamily enzyme